MRFLANENFPGIAVKALQKLGHDIAWVRIDAPGSSDQEVLRRARKEQRILITFDKDFGELAFRDGLPADCGIILFRILLSSPEQVSKRIVAALESHEDWKGHFAVIEETRIRLKTLPSGAV